MQNILITNSKFKPKSKIQIWLKRIIIILFFIFLIVAIYLFLFSPIFKIKQIILIEDDKETIYPKLLNNFETLLNKKNNFFKKNIFFLNNREVEKILLNDFPEFKSLAVYKKLPDRVIISFTKRKAEMLFCNLDCYSVDETGFIFDRFLKTEGFLFLIVKTDLDIKIGDKIVDGKFIDFLKTIKNEFGSKIISDLSIEEFSFSKDNLKTQDILAKTNEGWKIYFDLSGNPEEQVNNLKQVLEVEIKENRKNLEYVDLRFGNKIFYKYIR